MHGKSRHMISAIFLQCSFSCWLGDRKGIRPVKSRMLVCWWQRFDWNFTRLIAAVVTTTFIVLSSNEIQSGDILISANTGSPGKWPLKRRETVALARLGTDGLNPRIIYSAPQSSLIMPAGSGFEQFSRSCVETPVDDVQPHLLGFVWPKLAPYFLSARNTTDELWHFRLNSAEGDLQGSSLTCGRKNGPVKRKSKMGH